MLILTKSHWNGIRLQRLFFNKRKPFLLIYLKYIKSKDGGAPIEEYIIEMKDPSQKKEWIPVASSASTSGNN